MTNEKLLLERVGILEETVSTLLTYLRENSDTPQKYTNYNIMLQNAIIKSEVAAEEFE